MNAPPSSALVQAVDACVGIIRFRKGPEDVPASTTLLMMAIAGGVLLRIAMLAIPAAESRGNPVVLMALDIGITLLGVQLAVRTARHPERFVQTATALFGCQLVMAPFIFLARWVLLTYGGPGTGGSPLLLVSFVIAVWVLAVTARILRAATEWPLVACLLVALAIDMVSVLLALALYPLPEAAATPS